MSGGGRVVLDTTAYSRFRAGNESVIDWLAGAAVVYLPVTVVGELHAGFALGTRRRQNEESLAGLLREPFVEVLDVDSEVARQYGEIFAQLRRAGTPIPTNDIWIAATTLRAGGHLLTFDRDFEQVRGLPHTLFA